MGSDHRKSQFDRARDEFCSHVIRCDVLEAHMEDRLEWLAETMEYMAGRYPDLTELELAQLEVVGRRFVKPVIPHGSHAHAANRDKWEKNENETETMPGVEATQEAQEHEAEPLMAGVA